MRWPSASFPTRGGEDQRCGALLYHYFFASLFVFSIHNETSYHRHHIPSSCPSHRRCVVSKLTSVNWHWIPPIDITRHPWKTTCSNGTWCCALWLSASREWSVRQEYRLQRSVLDGLHTHHAAAVVRSRCPSVWHFLLLTSTFFLFRLRCLAGISLFEVLKEPTLQVESITEEFWYV